jgi:hypothetical protein
MAPRKSLLVDSAMILALILIGAIGYKLSPLLLPKADHFVAPDPDCDLQRTACTATLPGGARLIFSLTPRPIPVATPLTIDVKLEGLVAQRVKVDFAGVEMSMGYLRPQLKAVTSSHFVGEATLPVCVTGRMLWQATVLVETNDQRIGAPFRFEAGH